MSTYTAVPHTGGDAVAVLSRWEWVSDRTNPLPATEPPPRHHQYAGRLYQSTLSTPLHRSMTTPDA